MSSKPLTSVIFSFVLTRFCCEFSKEGGEPFERPLPIQDKIKAENTYTAMARVGPEPAIPAFKRHRSFCTSQSERRMAL